MLELILIGVIIFALFAIVNNTTPKKDNPDEKHRG